MLERFLARDKSRDVWRVLFVTALLTLPSLLIGFFADDHAHRATIHEPGSIPAMKPWDLFRFATGERVSMQAGIDDGTFPWWTDHGVKIGFFRPLSTALIRFDHAVFGDHAAFHHLHSIGWYLLVLAGVAALYRRVLGTDAAGLAFLFFVLDDSHVQPVGWLANRNALVAAAFALVAVSLHLRHRTDGDRRSGVIAPLAFCVALCAGEAAFGVAAYIVAYELAGSADPWLRRVRALVPYGVVTGLYLAMYKVLGYGTAGSGSYIHPLSSPVAYLTAAPARLLALAGGLLVNAPLDLWIAKPHAIPTLVAGCALAIVVFGLFLRATLRHLDAEATRSVRWLLCGSALSLLPFASTFPLPRMLIVPSIGVFGALATMLLALRKPSAKGERLARGVGTTFLVFHTVFATLLWAPQYMVAIGVNDSLTRLARDLEVAPDDGFVVMPVAPNPIVAFYTRLVRRTLGLPLGGSMYVISFAPYEHVLRRRDDRTFELEVRGEMLGTSFEQLFRDAAHPLEAGHVARQGALRVEVTEARGGRPTKILVTADRSLDDAGVRFIGWSDRRLRRLAVPKIGETITIPPSGGMLEMLE